jgi:Brp/Blh family beta-carotene 15,15'-monooxygenase
MLKKHNLSVFYLVVASASLGLVLLQVTIPAQVLLVILSFFLLIIGLPHGALDLIVALDLNAVNSVLEACLFLFGYVAIAGLSIVFWLHFPALAMSVFLLISIVHFSADWRKSQSRLVRYSIATILVCGPTALYAEQVSSLFEILMLSRPEVQAIVAWMRVALWSATGLLVILLVIQTARIQRLSFECVEITALFCSSLLLPPLWHFTLYFCALHSMKHILDVVQTSKQSHTKLLRTSLPIAAVSIAAVIGAAWFFRQGSWEQSFIRAFFILIFGLTISHMCIIHMWHRRFNAE